MKNVAQVKNELERVQRLKGLVNDYSGDLQTYNCLIAIPKPKRTPEQESHLKALSKCLEEYSEELINTCKEI